LFRFIQKNIYNKYLDLLTPNRDPFLRKFNKLLDAFCDDLKNNYPDYAKEFDWSELKEEFKHDFIPLISSNKWSLLHNLFIKLEKIQVKMLKKMLIRLFVSFIIKQKQIKFKHHDFDINTNNLSLVSNLLSQNKYLNNIPFTDLLILLKANLETSTDTYLPNHLFIKWYKKMNLPLKPVVPKHFEQIKFEGLTIQKTPLHLKKEAIYKTPQQKRVLITKYSHEDDLLACVIASHIGFRVCKHYVPVNIVHSKNHKPFAIQPFLANLKTIVPRRFEFITQRSSLSQIEALKLKLVKDPSLMKAFCEILATSFLVSDRDVHLGNIVLSQNKLFKIDHAWGIEDLGRLNCLSLFGPKNILRHVNQKRTAPSNGFRDYKFIMEHQVFFDSLKEIADYSEQLLEKTLTDIDDNLQKSLSISDNKEQILTLLMNRLGSQFQSKEYQFDVWKEEVVHTIKKGLLHRIHGLRLIAMSAELVNLKNNNEIGKKLQNINLYCFKHGKHLGRKLIPIEAQSYIKEALVKLSSQNKKTCPFLKDLFEKKNINSFNANRLVHTIFKETQVRPEFNHSSKLTI